MTKSRSWAQKLCAVPIEADLENSFN